MNICIKLYEAGFMLNV